MTVAPDGKCLQQKEIAENGGEEHSSVKQRRRAERHKESDRRMDEVRVQRGLRHQDEQSGGKQEDM